MPTIPFDPLPSAQSTGAPGAFLRTDAGPENFGGLSAAAGQRVGAATSQLGDVETENAIRFQKQQNEVLTDEANTKFDAATRQMLFGDGGFYTLRGKDAYEAMNPTAQKLEELRQSVQQDMPNPEARRMFDYISRRSAARELYSMSAHAATQNREWQKDTIEGAIGNEINNSATYWNDDQRFAESLGNIKIQAQRRAVMMGVDPASDAGQQMVTHYQSQAWQARIRSVMAQDPSVARDLFDANADQIDAPHRAQLDQQITSASYMRMMRDESQARRDEMAAERTLRTTQAANLANLTADTLKGKAPNSATLSDLVRTQQISPSSVEFLMGLSKRAGPTEDRADAVIALHSLLSDPSTSIDDRMKAITAAAHSGRITASTAGSLVDAAYRRDQHVETALEREARGTVLAAAGVPDGMINLGKPEAEKKAAVMSEWTDRVLRNGEDPITVRDDLVQKYQSPGTPPITWPRPKFGNVQSTQDVKTVAAATKAAADAGQLTPEQYQAEKVNLLRFAQFYQRVDVARAAAAQAKPGGPKAKLRGVTTGDSQ